FSCRRFARHRSRARRSQSRRCPNAGILRPSRSSDCDQLASAVVRGCSFCTHRNSVRDCSGTSASRQSQAEVLKATDRGGAASSRGIGLRDVLIVSEVMLSLLLLTGAGLAVRGLVALQQQKLGYDPNKVLTFSIPLPTGRYDKWSERQ